MPATHPNASAGWQDDVSPAAGARPRKAPVIYRFDDCELDTARVVVRRGGEEVPVEPQVFELLRYLIERRGEVVRKEEILDEVWGDRFVSESALTSRVKSARRSVGDDGTAQRVIRTVHGRGYEFVAAVDESGDVAEDLIPAAAGPGRAPTSLPLAVQTLIGRDELLDRLLADLADCRLVSIVGPAGVGKTSVGLELGRRATAPRDGVYLVELVTVGDDEAALAAIATTLDVSIRQQTSIDDAIIDMLRARQALLILDNCEHLVEPVADLVDRILHAAPEVTIVTTSREPLAVPGERVHVVEPLDVRGLGELSLGELAEVPAIALFVERAKAADSRFELTSDTAAAVAEICRRLDGIPLALELAASRTYAIDVVQLARRLDERLRLLKGVRRGADPRHSTLFDAISWSYDLLNDDEQRLFAKLAVFAGAFDLEAAEAVFEGEDVLDLLTRLSQRSMLAVRRPSEGGTQYEMLETLREFAQTRLDDLGNVALFDAHAHHFAVLAASTEDALRTPDEREAVGRVDRSFADLRAAQRFAVEVGDTDTAFGLITSIREYAMRRLRYEVFTWADAAAEVLGAEEHPLRPTLTALRAYGAFVRGEFAQSLALAETAEADALAIGLPPIGLVERVRCNSHFMSGDFDGAELAAERLIAVADESGIASQQAHAGYQSSVSASSVGDLETARERYEASFAAAKRTGSPTDMASAWTAAGFAATDDAQALDAFATADRLARSAGNRWMSAFARTEASALLVLQGDLRRGCAGLGETVDVWYRAGEWANQWLTLSRCVIALDRTGRPELATEILGAIERHIPLDAPPAMSAVRAIALATRESLEVQLGAERCAELRESGSLQPVETAVSRARAALLGVADEA
jgi:predicted ATPase/DNA-binding winged helix-turn-helix (wHTH) protein